LTKKKLEFERSTERLWIQWFSEKDLKKVKFAKVFEAFKTMLSVKDLPPDKMSPKTSILVSIYENEKARYDKMTRDNA